MTLRDWQSYLCVCWNKWRFSKDILAKSTQRLRNTYLRNYENNHIDQRNSENDKNENLAIIKQILLCQVDELTERLFEWTHRAGDCFCCTCEERKLLVNSREQYISACGLFEWLVQN